MEVKEERFTTLLTDRDERSRGSEIGGDGGKCDLITHPSTTMMMAAKTIKAAKHGNIPY
jgi:hypothetical protein